ncbi:nuclear transport factor 2 family protein [Amycolatopsis thermophila]|uniref:SnoaL-like domain-containing protein n=1 Tax=Amycolatopsis thermophila TaxID=206084 RepID=A0ABU0F6H7_9PSEU|nr:nuclear transport factor 2 family protein [Amycolatopsis thermophila]MDQ0382716.1 hypothetical protein [Amycolatopsis thermophila]
MSETDDYVAIIRLQQKYAHAVDTKNWQAAAGCFHAGSRADYRGNVLDGPEAILGHLKSVLAGFQLTQHHMSVPQFEADGDQGTAVTYVIANHISHGGEQLLVGARYDDEVVRLSQGWRFQQRRTTILWHQGDMELLKVSGTEGISRGGA